MSVIKAMPAKTILSWRMRTAIRFKRSDDGSAAVEFALISIPFCALLFAIIETALVFWCGQVLETAVANASRKIFTGELATAFAAVPAAQQPQQFKDRICAEVPGLFDCKNLVRVDVFSFKDFSSAPAMPSPIKNGAISSDPPAFNPGGSGEIVVVRAAMGYKLYTSFLSGSANLNNNQRMIMATASFRNEPYAN
jgi:Flp pilus assembly protein TadG